MDLVWKDIRDFEGLYQVSENGDIRNTATMKQRAISNWGDRYKVATLYKDGKSTTRYIHRIVADAFVEKEMQIFDCVNHIDGNKKNNHYSNLEWTDHSGNLGHAWDNKLRGNKPEMSNSIKSLNMRSRFAINELSNCGVDVKTIASSFNVTERIVFIVIKAFGQTGEQQWIK